MTGHTEEKVDLRHLEYAHPGYVAKLVANGARIELFPVKDLNEHERVALEQRMAAFAVEQQVMVGEGR